MAVSLVCRDEQKLLRDIEKLLNREIPKEVLEGYEPNPNMKAEPMKKGQQNQGCSQQKKKDEGRRRGKFPLNKNPLDGEKKSGSERTKKKHNQQKLHQKNPTQI
jgi:ATP-dependent RNA helicase RhlE